MKWPSAEKIKELGPSLPPGFTLDVLAENEVTPLTQLLRDWYPGIEVGGESVHLDPNFYIQTAFLKDGDPERPLIPVVLKKSDALAGLVTFSKDDLSKDISSRMGAVDPKERSQGFGMIGPHLLEAIGKAVGAELIYYYATLMIPHQQVIAEKMGFDLIGIMPANDPELVAPGKVKRVFEAIYAKPLVSSGEVALPPKSSLTEKTCRIWSSLFKDHPEWKIE